MQNAEDRAQRFHPSKFCGSIFVILRFAVKARAGIKAPDLIEMETLTCVVSCEGSEVYDLVLTQPIMVNLEPVNGYERKLTLNGER